MFLPLVLGNRVRSADGWRQMEVKAVERLVLTSQNYLPRINNWAMHVFALSKNRYLSQQMYRTEMEKKNKSLHSILPNIDSLLHSKNKCGYKIMKYQLKCATQNNSAIVLLLANINRCHWSDWIEIIMQFKRTLCHLLLMKWKFH